MKKSVLILLLVSFNPVFSSEQPAVKQSQLPLKQVGITTAIASTLWALYKGTIYYVNKDGGTRLKPTSLLRLLAWPAFVRPENNDTILLECARDLNYYSTFALYSYIKCSDADHARELNEKGRLIHRLTSGTFSSNKCDILEHFFTVFPLEMSQPVVIDSSSPVLPLHLLVDKHNTTKDACQKQLYQQSIDNIFEQAGVHPYRHRPTADRTVPYDPLDQAIKAAHLETLQYVSKSPFLRPLLVRPLKNGQYPIQATSTQQGFTESTSGVHKNAIACDEFLTVHIKENYSQGKSQHIDHRFKAKSREEFIKEGREAYAALQQQSCRST